MNVFTNIKKRRKELNMSQEDLAIAVGYKSRSSIAKVEAGEVDIPLSKLNDLSRVLDIPLRELMFESENANQSEALPGQISSSSTSRQSKNIAVVLAGGKSTRNLKNIPNQFINVQGRPVISYCLEMLQNHPLVDDIVLVCLKGWEDVVAAYSMQYKLTKLKKILPGGATGVLSVKNAYEFLSRSYSENDIVVFQESTRPLVTAEVVSRVINSCRENGTAAAYQPMNDYVQFDLRHGKLEYLERDSVVSLQLPEAYPISFIKEVFEQAADRSIPLTASWFGKLVYDLGYELNLVEGSSNNIKIVRQEDLATFSALLKIIEQ